MHPTIMIDGNKKDLSFHLLCLINWEMLCFEMETIDRRQDANEKRCIY